MDELYSNQNKVWLDAEEWRGLLSGLTMSFIYMKQILSNQADYDILYRNKGKKVQDQQTPVEEGLISSLSMSQMPQGM